MEQKKCSTCGWMNSDTFNFCPNCGKKLKDASLSTSVSKQIGIYAISLLFPPFGLIPAIRYLFQKEEKAKVVGMVALILTIISLGISMWLATKLLSSPIFTQMTSQVDQLQKMGY